MIRARSLVLPLAAHLLLGCTPDLTALTVPPPTAEAELDNLEQTIQLTQGIALGFECTYQGAPCASAEAEVDDTGIASVFPAYVDLLSSTYRYDGRLAGGKPRAVFVLVGNQAGDTTLTISSDDGNLQFGVTILGR